MGGDDGVCDPNGMGGDGGVEEKDGGGEGKDGGAVAKLKPQDSQNWPDLAVPQTGQDWSGPAACAPLPMDELGAAPIDEEEGAEGGDDAEDEDQGGADPAGADPGG